MRFLLSAAAAICAASFAQAEPLKKVVVDFGLSLPENAPVVIIDNSEDVPMKTLRFKLKKKLSAQEIATESANMCQEFLNWIDIGTHTYPLNLKRTARRRSAPLLKT